MVLRRLHLLVLRVRHSLLGSRSARNTAARTSSGSASGAAAPVSDKYGVGLPPNAPSLFFFEIYTRPFDVQRCTCVAVAATFTASPVTRSQSTMRLVTGQCLTGALLSPATPHDGAVATTPLRVPCESATPHMARSTRWAVLSAGGQRTPCNAMHILAYVPFPPPVSVSSKPASARRPRSWKVQQQQRWRRTQAWGDAQTTTALLQQLLLLQPKHGCTLGGTGRACPLA